MAIDFKKIYTRGPTPPVQPVEIRRFGGDGATEDLVATEEPLEIRLGYRFLGKPAERSVSVTMRTPGMDRELALGFLFGEGVITGPDDIKDFDFCGTDLDAATNIIRVQLNPHVDVDMASLQRNFYTTSSCGVCGKASLEALQLKAYQPAEPWDSPVDPDLIAGLPDVLRDSQPLFEKTGGIHAAGLFDASGSLIDLAEDVGRHNAMDKLIGARLLKGALPLKNSIVVLSGRASFELLQKALAAGVSIIVSVGAPSSLAIDLAEQFGITLVGFARKSRFNIYAHPERIDL